MININNKEWNHLCADDVCSFLLGGGEENFFFEFKSDKEKILNLSRRYPHLLTHIVTTPGADNKKVL